MRYENNFLCNISYKNLILQELSSLDYTLLIESLNGMDYGSGMAYSFFHGYLKLVLLIGETGKSFKDLISMYEDNHNVLSDFNW